MKTLKQTGPVSKYVSNFNLLCVQAKVPDAHKLHYWYDGLKPDIRSKTEYDPVTKQRFASIHDAQSAALAVDSFYNTTGNAGQSGSGNGQSNSNWSRKRAHPNFTPARVTYPD